MNAFTLYVSWIRRQPLRSLLSVVLVALGMATVTALLLFDGQFRERLTSDAQGIDLVVGAKGSPLQLLLSAVYHVDTPNGNIPGEKLAWLEAHPMVESATPLTIGDSYKGVRLVGTDPTYLDFYDARLADGRLWDKPFEVVLGEKAAQRTGLRIGDRFEGSHGFHADDDAHSQSSFMVVGKLAATGSVLDRLILTSPASTWLSHGQNERLGEITAVLIRYATPLAAARLPGEINRETSMTAAAPAFQAARLLALSGAGLNALRGFGFLLVAVAGLSIFIALNQALRERRPDLAVIRALGGSSRKIGMLMILEGLCLTIAGVVTGLIGGHLAIEMLALWSQPAREIDLTGLTADPREVPLVLLALVVALAASAGPALSAARMDIGAVLSKRTS